MVNIEKTNPETDNSLPVLYSDEAIFNFSFLCTVLFGCVLFLSDLKALNCRKGIFPAILFSIIYFAVSVFVLYILATGIIGYTYSGVTVVLLMSIGALVLRYFIWPHYIGKDIAFNKKSIRKPLIIALAIYLLLIVLAVWLKKFSGLA